MKKQLLLLFVVLFGILNNVHSQSCGGAFTDPAGPTANYANNSNYSVTIYPTNPGEKVMVTFTSFNIEAQFDALYVFNGNSANAPQIASSNLAGNVAGGLAGGYWGTVLPGPFTSSSPDGCLTFRFRSDASGNSPGWIANVTCSLPQSCTAPTSLTAATITATSAVVNWTQVSNANSTVATAWEILVQPAGSPAPTATTTGSVSASVNPFSVTGLNPGTCYTFYVRAVCSSADSSIWSTGSNFCTLIAPLVCGEQFLDNGGLTGNYADNSDSTVTIYPVNTGDAVTVTFTQFNTENNWDGLYVFDGNSINAPLISSGSPAGNVPGGLLGSFSGTTIPGPFTSSSTDGTLTFRFRSDSSINNSGWVANVTCGLPPTCISPNNLSINTISSGTLSLAWTEAGTATQWEVLALPLNSASPTSTTNGVIANVNSFIFNNLVLSSTYKFYVRAICSSTDKSFWSNPLIHTIAECIAPSNVLASAITNTGATIYWNSTNVASSYQVLVQPNGAVPPSSNATGFYLTNSTSYVITGLNCLAAYDVYVRKVCSSNWNSAWSIATTFSTSGLNPTTVLPPIFNCDDNGDGLVIFNLTTQIPLTSNSVSYYTSVLNAANQTNQIVNPTAFSVAISVPNAIIYVRETMAGTCDKMYNLQLTASSDCNLAHNCISANSLCGSLGIPFTNTHQGITAETGNANNYGCLYTTPNPTWFYLPVSTAGTINLTIEQSTTINFATNNLDVDYIVYGPFTNSVTPCNAGLNQTNTVSCSYSAAPVEYPIIPNAQVGQYYLLMVTNFSNQPGFIKINMNATSTGEIDCSGLRLNAFLDSNSNGSQDNGEVNFPLGQFHYSINNGAVHNIIAPIGIYNIYELNGTNSYDFNYTINSEYSSMYSLATTAYNNVNVIIGGGMVTYNFPITVVQNYNDLAVSLVPVSAPIAGASYRNKLVYANLGNQVIPSGTVTFNNDNLTTITTVSQSGITNITNGFSYNFTNLLPFETRVITITMQVPPIPTVAINQLLTNSASIIPPAGDAVVSNNSSLLSQSIRAAYDPNDKIESHGNKILYSSFNQNAYLQYTIRFENTGNASAINVSVNDILDPKIDESSLQMISASHNYTMDRIGRGLTWRFNNIQLPISLPNTDIGKGYITFKVKLKPGFAVGDIIPNTASIFFDSNPAIVTNTFNTEFVAILGTDLFTENTIILYPNPANSLVQITLQNTNEIIENIAVYDILGKKISLLSNIASNQSVIDVSTLSKGVYLVEILTENHLRQIKKLVIQ